MPDFDLDDDDAFAVEVAKDIARRLLRDRRTTPIQIVGLGHALYALERMPASTSGALTEFGIEYRHGNNKQFHKQKQPGMQKFGNITMKRGIFKDKADFYTWWNTVKLNTIDRRNIKVTLQDENDAPVVTWNIMNAWPTKVQSPDLKSDANEVAIETIEIAHEGITIKFGNN